MAAEPVELVNKRYEEAFDLIKYVFKVDQLYEDQIRLINAFLDGKNIFLARQQVMESPSCINRFRGFLM